MRALVLIPVAILLTAACGLAAAQMLGFEIHVRELMMAAFTCLIAGVLAVVPLILARGASQIAIVQAALIGTLVHLFVCVIASMVLTFAKLAAPQPYLFWMLGFYWMTL